MCAVCVCVCGALRLTPPSLSSPVPLRAPELSLTSRSPTDIQVSWQPLPHKLSRGHISAYRLAYRTSTDSAITQLELAGRSSQHLLEGLQPDTIYLVRISASTKVGWGEQSAWTSHRTPKASSTKGTAESSLMLLVLLLLRVLRKNNMLKYPRTKIQYG